MFSQYLLSALSSGLFAVVAWVSARLATYIGQKTKNEILKGILVRLDDAIFSAVREVAMTTVDAAKTASANGKLPPEIASAAKSAAVDKAKSYLGAEGIKILMHVLGLPDFTAVERYISAKAESALHQIKAAAPQQRRRLRPALEAKPLDAA